MKYMYIEPRVRVMTFSDNSSSVIATSGETWDNFQQGTEGDYAE